MLNVLIFKSIYMYLSGSTFLANVPLPNKQSFKVKSEFKSHSDASDL